MVRVEIEVRKRVIVELPIENYSDIDTDNMSIEESDAMIDEIISEKYGFSADQIIVKREIK